MDDFLLRKFENEISRSRLIVEQLRVTLIVPDRSSDREIRQATIALHRQLRIRAALLEPFSNASLN